MLLESIEYHDVAQPGWNFSRVHLGPVNLFVGATGSGKTRLLNAIFNVGLFVSSGQNGRAGRWSATFKNGDTTFEWTCEVGGEPSKPTHILYEQLTRVLPDGSKEALIDRTLEHFVFNGNLLPKLSNTSPALYLLREEESLAPFFRFFSRIKKRSFSNDALDDLCAYVALPQDVIRQLGVGPSLDDTFLLGLPLNLQLYVLKKHFKDIYEEVVRFYRAVFPNIERCEISELKLLHPEAPLSGHVPVFTVKERHVAEPIPLQDLSSGMQKVLLILADITSLPAGATYLIDEYENSLGVNAINFLPASLAEHTEGRQFIITTHHPYLINNMPVKDWRIFHRRGSNVTIKSGAEYASKFSRSKQAAFIQLMNDEFYTEGEG